MPRLDLGASFRARRLDLLALALLATGILVAFGDVLAADRGLYFRDHLGVFRPLWWAVREDLLALHLPTLTRFSQNGVPMEVGFNTATFTPMTLVLLLGDFDVTYDWFVIAHFFVLGGGAYALARRFGAEPFEALLSGAIAALSGPVLSQENLVTSLSSFAWIPWLGWGFDRLVAAPSLARLSLLGIFVAFHLQGLIPTLLLVDLGVLALVLLERRALVSTRALLSSVGAAVLGLGIAAIDVWPLLDVLPKTTRGAAWTYADLIPWSLGPAQVLDLFAPAFWAPPELPFGVVGPAVGATRPPYFTSLYLGPALVLGLAALPAAKDTGRRTRLWLVGVALAALVAATGPATPLHRLLAELPLLGRERYPTKYLDLTVASLAALVPISVRALSTGRGRPILAGLGLTVLGLAALSSLPVLGSAEASAWLAQALPAERSAFVGLTLDGEVRALEASMAARLVHLAAFALLLAAAVVAGAVARSRAGEGAPAARVSSSLVALVAVLVVADLGLAGRLKVFGAPTGGEVSELERLAAKAAPNHWIYSATPKGKRPPFPHQAGATYFEDQVVAAKARGYAPYRLLRQAADLDNDGQASPNALLPMQLLPFARGPAEPLRLLAQRGVAFIARPNTDDLPGGVTVELPGDVTHHLYPNPYVLPYARAYSRWRRIDPSRASREELLAALTKPDLWDSVPVYGDLPEPLPCTGTATVSLAPGSPDPRGGVVAVRVRAACPALVVVQEIDMPGWAALVDGREVPVVQAGAGFLAAMTDRGEHDVRFEYRAHSGARWTSLASAVLAVGLLLFGRRRGSPAVARA